MGGADWLGAGCHMAVAWPPWKMETGEFEPGPEGEEIPIIEMDLHSYADMNLLKEKLDEDTFDKVRAALGLERVRDAAEKGRKITEKVNSNLDKARKN